MNCKKDFKILPTLALRPQEVPGSSALRGFFVQCWL